jgi:hypothetical protein
MSIIPRNMREAPKYPTHQQIRAALVNRAAEYTQITGVSMSAIGRKSVRDPAFVQRLAQGQNFTVTTYQRVMDWLDNHWPSSSVSTSSR